MKILISGASGLIGKELSSHLQANGHEIIQLVRSKDKSDVSDTSVFWDPYAGSIDSERLTGIEAAINLSGANVAGGRWTAERKKILRDSRIIPTRFLAETLASLKHRPSVMLTASAMGYYGAGQGDRVRTENSPYGSDVLATICREWEAAALPAQDAGIRVVYMRIGVVLSRHGGALAKMLPVFRLGLGGRLGSGRQMMSWISITDLVRAYAFALENPGLSGPLNLVAPRVVSNSEFSETLGRVLGRPARLWVPALALKVLFGEMAESTILSGMNAAPERLLKAGFKFEHEDLETALRNVLGQ